MGKRIIFGFALLAVSAGILLSQNGRLVQEVEVPFSKELYQNILKFGQALPKLIPFLEGIPRKAETVRIKEISYLCDEINVKDFLLEPKKEGKYPCLIVNRGGNRDYGIWTKEDAFILLAEMASWGYVVAAPQYRGCGGGEGKEEFGGKDIDDVLSLIPMLESREKADPGRIGMLGISRGGMMTYIALKYTNRIRAAVVAGGITDLFDWEKARPEMKAVFSELIGSDSKTAPEALKARSAIFWPEKISRGTPILILHGTADERVPPKQAIEMALALLRTSHRFRLVMFEGGDHNLTDFWTEWLDIARKWFVKYL